MVVFVVGGGSGGHLTPLLAVAGALKSQDASISVVYVGQKNEGLSEVLDTELIDKTHTITAGKFRRYHGSGFMAHALDIKTQLLNVRDFFRFIIGSMQAWLLLAKEKPDVIFLKGGFVCVPVGFAARLRRIPYITHDSDAIPGLANRLTAKHARYNTTALEPERYPYVQAKTLQVGIPLQKEYHYINEAAQKKAKEKLGIATENPLIVSVGGGLGAQRLNKAVVNATPEILSQTKAHIIHLTGKKLYQETLQWYSEKLDDSSLSRVDIIDFSTELYTMTAAADLLITRGGATNLAEAAVQGKACIVVPNPLLTGGQQLHNAAVLKEYNAAVVIEETQLQTLTATVVDLISNPDKLTQMKARMHATAQSDAADRIATLLIELGNS